MQNTLEGISNRITEAEERISELEDKKLYTQKLDNLEEMDKRLEKHTHLRTESGKNRQYE